MAAIIQRDVIERGLTEEQWDSVIACGQRFSADCCRSINNSISADYGACLKKELFEALEAMEQTDEMGEK